MFVSSCITVTHTGKAALSKYQMLVQPRGWSSYRGDAQSLEQIDNLQSVFPLASSTAANDPVNLSVRALIRDTVLSSTAWVMDPKNSGLDLYDCCLVLDPGPERQFVFSRHKKCKDCFHRAGDEAAAQWPAAH